MIGLLIKPHVVMMAGAKEIMEEQFTLDQYMQTWRDRDPVTSLRSGASVTRRAKSQKITLLYHYANADLTDEEAGILSGLKAKGANYWRRCSDLRMTGMIEPTGKKRYSTMHELRMVCRITEQGRKELEGVQDVQSKSED